VGIQQQRKREHAGENWTASHVSGLSFLLIFILYLSSFSGYRRQERKKKQKGRKREEKQTEDWKDRTLYFLWTEIEKTYKDWLAFPTDSSSTLPWFFGTGERRQEKKTESNGGREPEGETISREL